jgi:predicted ABC-type ATPase
MARPLLYVLAGVNGAGKSSVGGHLLRQAGLAWFNPDAYARDWMAVTGAAQGEANAAVWQEGVRRLDEAVLRHRNFAFETTLGGNTIAARLKDAAASHDVAMWFCGLTSPEQHIARVRARVSAGGHDIPEVRIRERYITARANLIGLMPVLAYLRVYDNSAEAPPGTAVPDPRLVLDMVNGHVRWPTAVADLRQTPEWAKPLLAAAMQV